jgi:hypothetical protein
MYIQNIQNDIRNHQISWDEVEHRLKEDEEGKKDIETNQIFMAEDGTLTIDGEPGYKLTDTSCSQVFSRFIPSGVDYLKKCPVFLKAMNLNHWIGQKKGKVYCVRTRETGEGKYIRAILTERYAQYDNLNIFAEIVKQFRDYIPVGMTLTDTCFHLRLIQANGMDVSNKNVGDIVHGGLLTCNSETGMGKLRLAVIAYRLKCKNGLISPEASALRSKVHLGSHEDIASFFSESITEAREYTDNLLESLKSAGLEHYDANKCVDLVNYIGKRFNWPQAFLAVVHQNVLGEEATKFGLIQAITSAARGLPPEDRFRYERHAGSILMFSISQMADHAYTESKLSA